MSEAEFVWCFVGNKFRRFALVAPKLERSPNAPDGMLRYQARSNSKRWEYVHYGATLAECAERVNLGTTKALKRLQAETEALHKRVVVPGVTHEVCR